MTAAHRLKGVGWFASCVVVVLAFYLVSLQVAAERGKLDTMNARVADAARDIRALETEFDTRGNLAQLEKWNGDTLALTAPVAGQFVADEAALASIDVGAPLIGSDGEPVRTAALVVPSLAGVSFRAPVAPSTAATVAVSPAPAIAVAQVAAPQPTAIRVAAAPIRVASAPASPVRKAVIATTPKAKADMLRAVAVANVRPQAVAMLDRKLLSDSTLGDILSRARVEAGSRR
jgi:hypothetical protein